MTKPLRDERLLECVSVIRRLLRGEEVGPRRFGRGRPGTGLEPAGQLTEIWSVQPSAPPPPPRASALGGRSDHGAPTDRRPKRVLDAFRGGGGEGKPAYLQVHLSWAESEADALASPTSNGHQHLRRRSWHGNWSTPAQFDEPPGSFVRRT